MECADALWQQATQGRETLEAAVVIINGSLAICIPLGKVSDTCCTTDQPPIVQCLEDVAINGRVLNVANNIILAPSAAHLM